MLNGDRGRLQNIELFEFDADHRVSGVGTSVTILGDVSDPGECLCNHFFRLSYRYRT